MTKNNTPHSYIDQLTWLRGFAAFLVIISHTIRATEVKYFENDTSASHGFFSSLDLGTFGVLLFFALSGCTLYISNGYKLTSKLVGKFYIKRFFRIWPAFVVSIVFYCLFRQIFQQLYAYTGGHWIEGQFLDEVTISDLLEQAFLFSNFTGATLVNNAYWSLPVEFQYYLLFPLLVLSTRFIGMFGPIIVGLVVYFLPKFVPVNTSQVFTLALGFCGGVSVGFIYRKQWFSLNQLSGVIAILICFTLVSLQHLSVFKLPDIIFISNVWNFYSVIAILLVGIVLHTQFEIPNSMASFLKKYGDISYSTYLYHNLVIGGLMLVLLNTPITGTHRFYLLLAGTLLITQLLAHISHRFVEKPSMNFGRRF
tara:strand:+ start:4735 stop:5832 length:1098 start_codon:yes stop_codon:yes gene_type:complete